MVLILAILKTVKSFNCQWRARVAKIDQEKFRWLEYYKLKFSGEWYTSIIGKLVFKAQTDFGLLEFTTKNVVVFHSKGFILVVMECSNGQWTAGRPSHRGYKNQSLSSRDGSLMYNKFTFLSFVIHYLKTSASILLSFLESGNGYDSFRDFNPFNSKRSAGMGLEFLCLPLDCLELILVMDLTVQISAMIKQTVGKLILS